MMDDKEWCARFLSWPEPTLEQQRELLWALLEDIDTEAAGVRVSDAEFRCRARVLVRRRFNVWNPIAAPASLREVAPDLLEYTTTTLLKDDPTGSPGAIISPGKRWKLEATSTFTDRIIYTWSSKMGRTLQDPPPAEQCFHPPEGGQPPVVFLANLAQSGGAGTLRMSLSYLCYVITEARAQALEHFSRFAHLTYDVKRLLISEASAERTGRVWSSAP